MKGIQVKKNGKYVQVKIKVDKFRIYLHGKKRLIWIDSITPNGVAILFCTAGKIQRQYISHSKFYNFWKHRIVDVSI